MKYHIGDIVSCNVEVFKDKKRKLSIIAPQEDSKIEIMSFPIVAIDEHMQTYKIIIEPDMPGWNISKFHVNHLNVNEKFLGNKFYDISESLILNVIPVKINK